MTGDDWITLGKKYRKQNIGTKRGIYDLLLQLDVIFDNMDCALDCPCHAYCDKHADRTLCTVITVALEDLKNNR